MRISDWSSDVCSSDLATSRERKAFIFLSAPSGRKPSRCPPPKSIRIGGAAAPQMLREDRKVRKTPDGGARARGRSHAERRDPTPREALEEALGRSPPARSRSRPERPPS